MTLRVSIQKKVFISKLTLKLKLLVTAEDWAHYYPQMSSPAILYSWPPYLGWNNILHNY